MFKIIKEGETRLYVPVEGSFGKRTSGRDRKAPVFYNPHMTPNRDLCVRFMKAQGGDLVFADMLAGTGAKGIRVAVESVNRVFFNDANRDAVEIIEKNLRTNNIDAHVSNMDASRFVLENKGVFDFIDIDPFGTPVPFIDASLLSLKDGGYLGATATDTATLCGIYPETCLRRYQSLPHRSMFAHETGIRILLGYIARTAAKYEIGISPLLSHSTRHYFRIYLKTKHEVGAAEKSIDSMGYLYYCKNCISFTHSIGAFPEERACNCGSVMSVSGPMWLGDIQDHKTIDGMLEVDGSKDSEKLLKKLSCEISIPFYYNTHVLAMMQRVTPAAIKTIIDRIRQRGFRASRTHFSPVSIKTDASLEDMQMALPRVAQPLQYS